MEGIKGNLGYLRSGGTDEVGTPAVFSVEIEVTNDISGGILGSVTVLHCYSCRSEEHACTLGERSANPFRKPLLCSYGESGRAPVIDSAPYDTFQWEH